MKRAAISSLVLLAVVGAAMSARLAPAQELEPRSFVNTPVGLNFLLAGYGYTDGDVVFSAALPATDGEIQTHSGVLAYIRSVDVGGLSGKLGVIVPYAAASGSATLAGQPRTRDVTGFADPRFRFSVNLLGAPALSLEEFADYEQDVIVGITLDVSPPLGQYDSSKLVNIGTNRWAIKPEIGVSKALGEVTLEASAAATVYTANGDFLGGKTLEQEPLYSLQAHVIYEFEPWLWAALDATYYTGARPITDGEKGERLENGRLGLTAALTVSRHNSIKLYGNTGLFSRTGSDFNALGLAWQVRWGGGL